MIEFVAKRKEEKFIREVARIVAQNKFHIPLSFEAIPCDNDPRFMHLGIVIRSEIGIDHHHHMCFLSGSNGNWYSTKSEFHADNYRWIDTGFINPQHRANLLVSDYYYWTLRLGNGYCDEELWRTLYPGLPFIGEDAVIPEAFKAPPPKKQFELLALLRESGELSYSEYESAADRLERQFYGHGRINHFDERNNFEPDPW